MLGFYAFRWRATTGRGAMEWGFYILIRGRGEILRRSFYEDGKVSAETRNE
jgi:hypothetical protein